MDLEVFALVGPSGTGKSYRAIATAYDLNAEIIIDDGLLIKGNRILTGVSAKRQPTRIGAIKTALFMDDEQARQAREVLREINPRRILILGTSKGMVDKIVSRLSLPPVSRVIPIDAVASQKEIKKARAMRVQYSKHVIPAPTMEVKKRFPDIITDSLQVLLHRKDPQGKRSWLEQSVVRPTFTYFGKLTITQHALAAIVTRATREVDGVKSAGRVLVERHADGVVIEVHPVLYYGCILNQVGRQIQDTVKRRVEEMTGLSVKAVNVLVKEVFLPDGKKGKGPVR
ncbi:Asp23/Gls24 family envelope stress response protein [Desulfofundulus thermobenzoicus]|uniref:Asp23/Gls24 family envelope stress response protein n=1 Tax=Desulfofundulus thermobenzoicus TaxID=29376 RepID=A0A6N7ISQ3_9FIRM|nr:Asp23/Gls24 family envelope stress response protein [Desulfofundulus thermobenzoicus]HHW43338.1 Asp23/Gls24 family envelope stress response protein [Desulfotomaculum sp.]